MLFCRRASNLQRGYAPAELLLGKCYLQGEGVQRDEKVGVEWLLRVAERNGEELHDILDAEMAEVHGMLAQSYAQGMGVERDAEVAADHFLEAAELGHLASQYNLSLALEAGTCILYVSHSACCKCFRLNIPISSRAPLLRSACIMFD